ncbi:MAG: narK [Deltaproteobacteria bacterium]|nr:narK [Deltaproteobacteria bacterium]
MIPFENLKGRALFWLLFIWFLWFLSFTTRAIFSPVLPLLEDEFSISHAAASSIFAFMSLGYSLSLLASGILGGRIGYKKSIAFCLIASALVFLAIPFVQTFPPLRFLSFLLGLAAGIYLPSSIPLITAYYHDKTWGKTIPIHDSAASFSIFASPFICLGLLTFLPWRGIFAFIGIVALFSGTALLFLGPEVKIHKGGWNPFWTLIKKRSLWVMAFIWLFAATANMGLYFIFPLYLTKELQIPLESAHAIFGFSRLGGIGVAIAAAFIVDRLNLRKLIFFILLLTGLLTLSLVYRDLQWLKVLLFLQASIAVGFFPVALVLISRIFKQEVRGQAMGLIVTFGVIFGIGLGPYLLGISGDLISFRFGIGTLGILTVLSSGLIFLLPERLGEVSKSGG